MSVSGWIMMVIVLVGVWGGFVYLLLQTAKLNRDQSSTQAGPDIDD